MAAVRKLVDRYFDYVSDQLDEHPRRGVGLIIAMTIICAIWAFGIAYAIKWVVARIW